MGFEIPKSKAYSPEEIEEMKGMRKRVDALRGSDNKYEDHVKKLAEKEEEFRRELEKEGIHGGAVERLADSFSDETLEKFEAEKEKWVDKLTGLKNRNAFQGEALQILNLERREGHDCSVLMIDFDFFKKVNDEYGHPAGDEALRQLAGIIRDKIRNSDFVYRYGGEEFVVVLPDTDLAGALTLAERIREAVEKATVEVSDKNNNVQKLNRTVSIGCASMKQISGDEADSETALKERIFKKIIDNADSALYHSKEEGRNRVTAFGEERNFSMAA